MFDTTLDELTLVEELEETSQFAVIYDADEIGAMFNEEEMINRAIDTIRDRTVSHLLIRAIAFSRI